MKVENFVPKLTRKKSQHFSVNLSDVINLRADAFYLGLSFSRGLTGLAFQNLPSDTCKSSPAAPFPLFRAQNPGRLYPLILRISPNTSIEIGASATRIHAKKHANSFPSFQPLSSSWTTYGKHDMKALLAVRTWCSYIFGIS